LKTGTMWPKPKRGIRRGGKTAEPKILWKVQNKNQAGKDGGGDRNKVHHWNKNERGKELQEGGECIKTGHAEKTGIVNLRKGTLNSRGNLLVWA